MHLACQTWRRGFPQELEEQPGRIDVRCRVPDAGRRDRDIASAYDVFAKPTRKSPARMARMIASRSSRSEEHTSELQSLAYLVCRLLLEKKKKNTELRASSRWNVH